MNSYKESIAAAGEFAANKLGEAAKVVASLATLEEKRLKTDATIAETLQQLHERRRVLTKTIDELERIQKESNT